MVDSSTTLQPEQQESSALSNLKKDYFGFDGSDFRISKKDKRVIKHGNLLAKVREAGIEKTRSTNKKRRRPNKKLNTDIADLGDALPDVEEAEEEWEGIDEDEAGGMHVEGAVAKKKRRRRVRENDGKMEMKSLKMRQGAMKRKRKMEESEIERMQRNLALLAQGRAAVGEGGDGGGEEAGKESQKKRWEALRAFIGGTMQRDEAFKKT